MARYGDSKYSIIDVRRSLTRLCGRRDNPGAFYKGAAKTPRLPAKQTSNLGMFTCSDDFEASRH